MCIRDSFNPQLRHLRQVNQHITLVRTKWEEYKRTHPELQAVQLFAYTGGDGMFGAYGYVDSEADLTELKTFMESTSPPRPIYVKSVHVLGIKPSKQTSSPQN